MFRGKRLPVHVANELPYLLEGAAPGEASAAQAQTATTERSTTGQAIASVGMDTLATVPTSALGELMEFDLPDGADEAARTTGACADVSLQDAATQTEMTLPIGGTTDFSPQEAATTVTSASSDEATRHFGVERQTFAAIDRGGDTDGARAVARSSSPGSHAQGAGSFFAPTTTAQGHSAPTTTAPGGGCKEAHAGGQDGAQGGLCARTLAPHHTPGKHTQDVMNSGERGGQAAAPTVARDKCAIQADRTDRSGDDDECSLVGRARYDDELG